MKYVKRGMVFAFCSIILSACSSNINSVDENNDGIDDNLLEQYETSRINYEGISGILDNKSKDLSSELSESQKEYIAELIDENLNYLNSVEYGVGSEIDKDLDELFTKTITNEKDLLEQLKLVVDNGDSKAYEEVKELNKTIALDNLEGSVLLRDHFKGLLDNKKEKLDEVKDLYGE